MTLEREIQAVALRIHDMLSEGACSGGVATSVGIELACVRTFIELCANRAVADGTIPASDRCRIECEIRQQFDGVLCAILPKYLDIVAQADVIADVELAAERRQRS